MAFLATFPSRLLAAPGRGKVNAMADKISGNIVQIQDYAGLTKKSGTSNSSRLLQDCRNTVLERTADALARAMDNVDDSLFALADKASNNTLQSHYFDAMREIRLKRKEIEASFREHFKEKSDEIIDNKFTFQAQTNTPSMADIGLSLIEDDDLEESLAITTLADKISTICHNEIYGLDKRVGLLLGKKELETEANPIGPKTICIACKMACGKIDSGVDIKLIVFKLIDRYLCESIQQVYRDINNHLAMSGILPKIPTQIGRDNPAEGGVLLNGMAAGLGANGGETDFLSAFSQILSTNNVPTGGGMYSGPSFQGMPNMATYSPTPGVFNPAMQGGVAGMIPGSVHGTPTTLQNLTFMQKGQWDALGIDTSSIDAAALANGTANILWSIKNSPLPREDENGDEMIIEIVALLFDYIFENPKVPDKAKALIGRLQIPILKAAMLDNTFFSMRNHPARRLLNTLAQSTIGLLNAGDEESPLYKGISDCVQKILDEFDTDIGVFETAIAELESHIENHQSHFDENIEEAKKLIQGRERLLIAESLSSEEIERRLEGKLFPQFIRTFAMESWKNLLIVTYMKEGQENESWRSKLEMLDLLIWSTLPKPTLKDRKKLVDMLPTLLSGIEEGMRLMSMDTTEQDKFMEKLSDCHARLVNSETQPMDAADKEPGITMNNNTNIDLPKPKVTTASTAEQKPHKIGSISVEEVRVLGQGPTPSLDDDRHDQTERLDINLNLFDRDITDELDQPTAVDCVTDGNQEPTIVEDECTALVRNMIPGIWFEFHQEDGTKSMERLAWISSVLGSYLFTNHEGLKTREVSTQELEESLRTGRAILADDLSFLVDSSFNNLLDDMQKKVAG
jgi:hypothetical protein